MFRKRKPIADPMLSEHKRWLEDQAAVEQQLKSQYGEAGTIVHEALNQTTLTPAAHKVSAATLLIQAHILVELRKLNKIGE